MSDLMSSLVLSNIMGDIGVTEEIVAKRRRSFMIMEAIDTPTLRYLDKNVTTYNLGSQSEGSTTHMLDSDIDTLFEYQNLNPIQDWGKEEHGAQNALMVQDEDTAPGHCFLQVQSRNISFPFPDTKFDNHNFEESKGRLLLKNTCFDDMVAVYDGRNGPAHTFQGRHGQNDEDNVIAWHCKYWPTEAQQWLENDGKGIWPSEGLKRKCKETGCTIVPISSKGSQFEELEWRISTCLAERCLMFSLNITQIRCYVLLKMIRKTFLEPKFPSTISSYICKTVLFHCLQDENSLNWQEDKLMSCLESCLFQLEKFVRSEYCPHFMIPGHNLLKGKISEEIKDNLLQALLQLKNNLEKYLCDITFDNLGFKLHVELEIKRRRLPILNQNVLSVEHTYIQFSISAKLLRHIAAQLSLCHKKILKRHSSILSTQNLQISDLTNVVVPLTDLCDKTESELEKSALELLIPFFRTSLASTMASCHIGSKKKILELPGVITYFLDGINSDVSSGKLKFASALYCAGEFTKTIEILITLQDTYDAMIVETICKCNAHKVSSIREGFLERAHTGGEELIKDITSFCIRFLPSEKQCVPRELQYEMFRSTTEDKLDRNSNEYWMNWAVVDSLPYLYFLLYKIYGRLQEMGKKRKALSDLDGAIKTEPNLGHRETALNLLGQCMEQETRYNEALYFYRQSLNLIPKNNAAKIHICLMISTLINRKYCTGTKKKSKKNKKQKYKQKRKK